MKTIFIALLALATHSRAAETDTCPHNLAAHNNCLVVSQPSATSANLQQENQVLRTELGKMEEKLANLESAAAYREMMHVTLDRLEADKIQNRIDELQAALAYSQLMGRSLLKLQHDHETDSEATASANAYRQVMTQTLASLHATAP